MWDGLHGSDHERRRKRLRHLIIVGVSSDSFPAPVYAETVLSHNFEDAKKYFLDDLLRIHDAHTRMLAAQNIITAEEENRLLAALASLDRAAIAEARYDGSVEDLFFYIEAR